MDYHAEGSSFSRPEQQKGTTLHQRWQTLDAKKTPMYRRTEDYAMWTLPYVFPVTGGKDVEMQGPVDSTGPRATNNLSNKLVMTLFQPSNPFFRMRASSDVLAELDEQAKAGDQGAQVVLQNLDKTLAQAEKDAMQLLDYNRFRTEATMITKQLIVTGNALAYHPEQGRVQSYNLRDYCIVRDLAGTVIEILTRDKKAFSTFPSSVQDKLREVCKGKKYKDSSDVTIYTQVCLKEDGKYHMKQAADEFMLETSKAVWAKEDMPYIVLTWNLLRGEDYGRGLVEDYAGAFHGLYVLNNALTDMVGVASDIKFLVDPSSPVDVQQLNDSESGSYHVGREGDVTTPQFNKQLDMQFVLSMIERFERQIGQAFLLTGASTRDAERVTAEEIRLVANELELSHGGIYSRFAEEWQLKLAVLLLRRLDFKIGENKSIYPQIITGLDSLSRAGDLDKLRMFIANLQLLNEVPEDIRAVINPLRFAEHVGIQLGVESEKFTKTPQEIQAEQQAQMRMQEQAMNMQAAAGVAEEAGREAVRQS